MPNPDRAEFGEFLRSRRHRLSPEAAGLPEGRRRRTPGLRREEIAERAGIGVDWYVRLEQGRAVGLSSTTLEALCRALQLDDVERAHLHALARDADPRPFRRETVPDAVRRMVESLGCPAYVTGRRWDLLAWNDASVELFTDFGRFDEDDRNILVYVLTDPGARRLFGQTWADEGRRLVGLFRTAYGLWANDPAFASLLARLKRDCPEFEGWWAAHDVRAVRGGRKSFDHPKRGPLRFDHASFQANDDPALRLVIYTPA